MEDLSLETSPSDEGFWPDGPRLSVKTGEARTSFNGSEDGHDDGVSPGGRDHLHSNSHDSYDVDTDGVVMDIPRTNSTTSSIARRRKTSDVNSDDEEETQSLVSPLDHGRYRHLHTHDRGDDDGLYDEDDLNFYGEEYYDPGCCSGMRCLGISMMVVLVIAALALLLPTRLPGWRRRRRDRKRRHSLPVGYKCPQRRDIGVADNYIEETFTHDYANVSQQIPTNVTEWLQEFRTDEFDNWGHSYDYVKNHSYAFKSKYYPPNLKNGDTIYESACGVGLNLYMTLEILKEVKGIEELVVYGNEYVPESVTKSKNLFDSAPPASSQRGLICQGDSTHLHFVPSDSFDLVYTGYIR